MFGFSKRIENNGVQLPSLNGHNPANAQALPEVEELVFIESAPASARPEPSAVSIEHNIGILYTFLDRNHEVKGYDDALLNPDTSNLNQNLEAPKSDLIRTLKKVKTYYEDFIQ